MSKSKTDTRDGYYGRSYYCQAERGYHESHLDRARDQKALHPFFWSVLTEGKFQPKTLLDAGCGLGLYADFAASQGVVVTGLDRSSFACQESSQLLGSNKVVRHDLEKTAIPFRANRFDAVACLDVIEHVKRDQYVLNQIYRVIKPGGRILITTPNASGWWHRIFGQSDFSHVNVQDQRYWRQLLTKTGFINIELTGIALFDLLPHKRLRKLFKRRRARPIRLSWPPFLVWALVIRASKPVGWS